MNIDSAVNHLEREMGKYGRNQLATSNPKKFEQSNDASNVCSAHTATPIPDFEWAREFPTQEDQTQALNLPTVSDAFLIACPSS